MQNVDYEKKKKKNREVCLLTITNFPNIQNFIYFIIINNIFFFLKK